MTKVRGVNSAGDELVALVRNAIRDDNLSKSFCYPAEVVRVTGNTVRIKRGHVAVATDFEDETGVGEKVLEPIEIDNVPVLVYGSESGYIVPKINAGTKGVCIVADRSLGTWLLSGAPSDPEMSHTNNMGDAFFIPSMVTLEDRVTVPQPLGDGMVVGSDNLLLGSINALRGVARLNDEVNVIDTDLAQWIVQIQAAVNGIINAFAAAPVVPADGGAAFKAALVAATAPLAGSPVTPPFDGLITSASNTVKAAD